MSEEIKEKIKFEAKLLPFAVEFIYCHLLLAKYTLKYADPFVYQLFDIGANLGLKQQQKNVD